MGSQSISYAWHDCFLKYISSKVDSGEYDILLSTAIFLEKEALTVSTWECHESLLSIVTPGQLVARVDKLHKARAKLQGANKTAALPESWLQFLKLRVNTLETDQVNFLGPVVGKPIHLIQRLA